VRVAGRKLLELLGVYPRVSVAACSAASKPPGSPLAPSNASMGAELARNSRLRLRAGMMHTYGSWGTGGGSGRVQNAADAARRESLADPCPLCPCLNLCTEASPSETQVPLVTL